MMPRPQFSLKTLLWLLAVAAAFLRGAQWERYRHERELAEWDIDLEQAMRELFAKTNGDANTPFNTPRKSLLPARSRVPLACGGQPEIFALAKH